MPLDAAEFISELSITDPEGTDPLNQGDDQIRTTKRATFQSFPNIDAPVPQTAAQMAQMAIKNEVNVFTQANTFAANQVFQNEIIVQRIADTSPATLSYRNAAGSREWETRLRQEGGGTNNNWQVLRYANGVFVDIPFEIDALAGISTFRGTRTFFPSGVAGAPGISFEFSQNMGFRRLSSSIMTADVGGVERMRWQTSDATLFTLALAAGTDGTAAIPSYSWFSERTAGWYRAGRASG